MNKYFYILLLIGNVSLAQTQDAVLDILRNDSLKIQYSVFKADSIATTFQTKANNLNAFYQNQFSKIDGVRGQLQSKIDSLNNINRPTDELTKKIDSLNQIVNERVASLTKKLDDLKGKVTQGLNEIQLPPQLEEPMQKLQSSIDSYTLPSLTTSASGIPSIDIPDFGKTQLPTLSKQLNLNTDLGSITGNLGNINAFTGKAGEYARDAQNLVKGNINEVKNIDKTFEGKVAGMEGVGQLQEGTAMVGQFNQLRDSSAMKEKAQALVKEQVMLVAKDHFAGKQEVLQQAMDKMSKLKNKYSEVKSLAELPKRLPNPLKGKPFIERLVPALTFQIQKSDYFLLDVNPMLMYLISPRISVGAGWNQRLPLDDLSITNEESVYGPRVAFEVKWTKGINFRLLPEIMNTTIPSLMAQSKGVDPAYREWIGSLFVGMKKDFVVYKQLKGNTEVLYNLYDPDGMSPYGDKLLVRFGFEFPMKKK